MSLSNGSTKTFLNQEQFSDICVQHLRAMGFAHGDDVVVSVVGFKELIPIVIEHRKEKEFKKEGMVLLRDNGDKKTQA